MEQVHVRTETLGDTDELISLLGLLDIELGPLHPVWVDIHQSKFDLGGEVSLPG